MHSIVYCLCEYKSFENGTRQNSLFIGECNVGNLPSPISIDFVDEPLEKKQQNTLSTWPAVITELNVANSISRAVRSATRETHSSHCHTYEGEPYQKQRKYPPEFELIIDNNNSRLNGR